MAMVVLFSASGAAAQASVTIALQPATQTVSPGDEFELSIAVTQSGSEFNAFEAVVAYAPAALTLIQLSPLSLQEGELMKAACTNRFHRFRLGTDRDTITDVLLCNGVSVPGPGRIYRLRFCAAMTPQTTKVSLLPGVRFYNAGIGITPVSTTDATIQIGATVGVEPGHAVPPPLRLRASPNPFHSLTVLQIDSDASGPQEVTVCDLLGRAVRRLGGGWFNAGRRGIPWDGRDEAGVPLAPGIYYVQLRAPAGVIRTPVVRLD